MLGPFVYICAVLCHKLLQLDIFAAVNSNRSLRYEVLDAACAAGVSSVFSAPVGGVLFSIETTATFYLASNLWKSLVASSVGGVGSFLLHHVVSGGLWQFPTSLPATPYTAAELPAFAVVGVLSGILSVVIIKSCKIVQPMLRRISPVALLFGVGALTAILSYWAPLMRFHTILSLITNFFTVEFIEADGLGVLGVLAFCAAVTAFLLVLAISSPVPGGLSLPDVLLGAVVGRFVGELMRSMFGNFIYPQAYAIVGGAALVSGMTSSLSSSVILFEATCQIVLLIPVLVGVLFDRGVSSLFERSIYEVIVDLKRIPVIRRIPSPGYICAFGRRLLQH